MNEFNSNCSSLTLSCIFIVLPTTAKPIHHHGQDCLRLRVDVAGRKSASKNHHEKSKEEHSGRSVDGGKTMSSGSGGVHNPSNRLPAGEHVIHSPFHSSGLRAAQLGVFAREATVMKSNPDSFLVRLPSDDPAVMEPNVQRSIGNSAQRLLSSSSLSSSLYFSLMAVSLTLMLH